MTPIAVITPKPLALAGQSNAWLMRPILEQMYRPGVVVGFAQDGSKIAQWAEGSEFWTLLAKDLHQPLRAFVWWQGESDRDDPATYSAKLRSFLERVRREANDPTLLIVECRVIDASVFVEIRAIQEAYVKSDARSVLVSSDALPLEAPDSAHLNADGYRSMVTRILAVIP